MPDPTPDTPDQPAPEAPEPPSEPTAAITSRTAVVAAVLLLTVVLAAVALMQLGGDDSDTPEPGSGAAGAGGFVSEGTTAPDFTLTSLEGETISLSDYAGRPVLINFWASWCPPCREEFPVLADARTTYLDDGFEVLGVTRNDQPDLSQKFVDESGAEWPILPDLDDAAWELYGAVGLPTSYFVDRAGVVQRVHIGPVNEEQLANHLAAIGLGESLEATDQA